MRGILWTLALVCASATYALPTPDTKCSDPHYACRNLFIAHECQTVKSCIQTVWEKLPTPKDDNNEICDICKEMVKEARDTLLSNETQEELREVFEGSCNLIPIKFIANACKKLADDYIPDLVDALASRMDPTQVCSVAGLCLPTRLPSLIAEVLEKQVIPTKLQPDSEQSSSQQIEFFTNEAGLDDLVVKICHTSFPVSADLCKAMVHHYMPMVQNYIKTSGIIRGVGDNMTCEFCESVLQYLKTMITSESTEEELRTALANFCSDLGALAQECKQFVDQYFDQVFNYIKNVDVHSVCTMLGLCEGSTQSLLKLHPALNDVLPLAKRMKPPHPSEMPMLKLLPARWVSSAEAPMLKLVPAQPAQKVMPMLKLLPALPATRKNKYEQFKEVIAESNSVNEKSQQLPLARLMHPLIPLANNMDCVVCKALTYFLEMELADGIVSEERTLDALDKISETWLKELADQARAFLSQYSEQIVAHLMKGQSPRTLCSSLNVCTTETKGKEVGVKVIQPSRKVKGATCDICKEVIQILDEQLQTNKTEAAVKQALDQVCSILPQSLAAECRDFVDIYAEDLINLLVNELNPDTVCETFRLCPGSRPQKVKIGDELECNLCKQVIAFLDSELQDNRTEAAIKQALDKVCSVLPQSVADKCVNFVNQYTDILIDLLTRQVDPETLCAILQLCPGSITLPTKKQNDNSCELCKQIVEMLDQQLKDNRTEEAIKQALDKVCSLLPESISEGCRVFVDMYRYLLIDMLADQTDPTTICTMLGLCQGSITLPTKKQNDINCELCKQVVEMLDRQLKDNRTEEAIKQALERVCSLLPESIGESCRTFVDQYTDLLINMLADQIDPTTICTMLGLCQSSEGSAGCALCNYVLHYLQDVLTRNSTQDEIKKEVEKVCQKIPSALREDCENFIEEYGSSVIALLTYAIDPSVVCVYIRICPGLKPVAVKPLRVDECQLCENMVGIIDTLLENDKVDQEIVHLVEKVCAIVPAAARNQCVTSLETYGPYILQMIGELATAKQVCQAIDMCPRTAGHVHLLGEKYCTYGPSYWCKSPVHAAACKAEAFCQENIWKN